MIFKLAFINSKKYINNYIVYLTFLSIETALFFFFSSLPYSSSISYLSNDFKVSMKLIIPLMSFCVFISIFLLVRLTNKVVLKRRYSEFALYISLGMELWYISLILLVEILILGMLSLILGLFLGSLLCQGWDFFLCSLFDINPMWIHFSFSFSTFKNTILLFLLLFIVVWLLNCFSLYFYTPLKLIHLNSQKKLNNGVIKKINISLCFVSLILLLWIYTKLFSFHFNKDILIKLLTFSPFLIGLTYLFYYSLCDVVFLVFERFNKLYCKGINLFTVKNLCNKIKNTWFFLATISLLLVFSCSTIFLGALFKITIKNTYTLNSTDDLEFYINEALKREEIEHYLIENNIKDFSLTEVYIGLKENEPMRKDSLKKISIKINSPYNREQIMNLSNKIEELHKNSQNTLQGKLYFIDENKINNLITLLFSFYIGITSLLTAISLIVMEILIEKIDRKKDYIILNDIGIDSSCLKASSYFINTIYFFVPFILALPHIILAIIFTIKYLTSLYGTIFFNM
ncbi:MULTISPECIES: FtsX-like permease family protein [unclassified Clostridium]|uniref:ABC transporter, permease protein n=2 Tax=Clostridium TaxID=1485 RepID=B2THH9_CLOBB|nr:MULTISPECIES: FtsX-like permease family protein [unclassified Clostridium]ACD21790.1 putative ABC transporter, permease protein [Clostridium botulinum B str. Eklund 17B (NRP)]MBN1038049.1 ABC transporter permease [Clostridium botulinum]MBY6975053.1 FtsX-like permease family protein [Clostridium botulinum]MBY7000033.1 FtsX-like permease family protein [Clostridium botulinum]MCR1274806.1 FtsX-like permease family protein [Clostridium botulinum]